MMKRSIALGLVLGALPFSLAAQSPAPSKFDERKAELKKELESLEGEIQSYRDVIEETQAKAETLEEEVGRLNISVKREEEGIRLRIASIGVLSQEIADREQEIKRLDALVLRRREELADTLQVFAEEDALNVFELLLRGATLAESVARFETITQLQSGIALEVEELRVLVATIIERVEFLEEKRDEERELRHVQELARQELERKRRAEKDFLAKTRGEEKRYRDLLGQSQKTAEAIRQQLFVLEGVGVALKFEEALKLAEHVSGLAGVRPAFLLAVLQKESKWGERQGTGTWRQDMHPRDHQAFMAITKELGLDPDKMLVSKKPWYGWGGAMGPAQFIPTTWLIYKDDVARLTGHNPPSPWNINDAFVAAGVKLGRGGATARTPEAEWKAAMIYFAGKNWQNKSYAFYGDSVMELAAVLQEQIDVLKAG